MEPNVHIPIFLHPLSRHYLNVTTSIPALAVINPNSDFSPVPSIYPPLPSMHFQDSNSQTLPFFIQSEFGVSPDFSTLRLHQYTQKKLGKHEHQRMEE